VDLTAELLTGSCIQRMITDDEVGECFRGFHLLLLENRWVTALTYP
jgi:hypothetical protein